MAHAPWRRGGAVNERSDKEIPPSFPEMNTGVIFFKEICIQSKVINQFLSHAKVGFDNRDDRQKFAVILTFRELFFLPIP